MKISFSHIAFKFTAIFVICLIFSLSHSNLAQAQVSSGNIELHNQAEVDSLDCTSITKNLLINGFNINDLPPFTGLVSVGGNLTISTNLDLTNLVGLSNLISESGQRNLNNDEEELRDGLSLSHLLPSK